MVLGTMVHVTQTWSLDTENTLDVSQNTLWEDLPRDDAICDLISLIVRNKTVQGLSSGQRVITC